MATDNSNTSGPGGQGYRRPLTIDLAADKGGRQEEGLEAASRQPGPSDESGADAPSYGFEAGSADDVADASVTGSDPATDDRDDDWRDDQLEGASRHPAEEAAAPVPPPVVERAPRQRRTSFAALLAAALLGGLVSAAALWGLDRAGYLGRAGAADPEVAQLRDEVAGLGALRGEVAQLREAGAAPSVAPAADTPDLAPLRDQVAALEQGLAELRDRPAGDAPAWPAAAAIAELRSRIAELERRPAGPPGSASPALEGRLEDLAGQVQALRGGVPATAADPALAELPARLEDLGRRIGALEGRPPVDIAPLETSIDEVRGRVTELGEAAQRLPGIEQQISEIARAQERVPPLQAALDELRVRTETFAPAERVATLEADIQRIAPLAESAEALGPAVAANALASALDSGAPFRTELNALRGLGLGEEALAGLEPHADSGLPTLAALQGQFEAALAAVDLSNPVPARAGTVDRLMQSARNLVEVRPANPTSGSDPGAVVARMRGAVEAGDLQTALNEWNALPEAPKAALAGWAEGTGARLAAEQLVGQLRSEALSRIARGS